MEQGKYLVVVRVFVGVRVVLFVFLELYLCYIVCDLSVVFIVVMHGTR